MRIGISGMGFVGRSVADDYRDHAELVTFDISHGEVYPAEAMRAVDLEFICVGTPSNPDGSCDISHVEAAVAQSTAPLVVLKSTVPAGTTESLVATFGTRLVFSPEFFGEGAMSSPFWNDRDGVLFTIVGGEQHDVSEVVDLLAPLEQEPHNFFRCSAREAELIKYFENCFLATKVAIFNEFHDLAVAVGADWDRVREGFLLDPRIGISHTVVTEERGFGGRCFPKDTAALLHQADSLGIELEILRAAVQANARVRKISD
jgi:UDPglucose 6-dehydrogenase